MKKLILFLACFSSLSTANAQQILEVPGLNEFAKIDTNGHSVLPSGRYVTPAGKTLRITDDPFGLSISPDKNGLLRFIMPHLHALI